MKLPLPRLFRLTLAAGLGVALLSGAAQAQRFEDETIVIIEPGAGDRLRPGEILSLLDENGYSEISRLRLRGNAWRLIATDPRGRRVRLVIDAYDGRILGRSGIAGTERRRPRRGEEWGSEVSIDGEIVNRGPRQEEAETRPRRRPRSEEPRVGSEDEVAAVETNPRPRRPRQDDQPAVETAPGVKPRPRDTATVVPLPPRRPADEAVAPEEEDTAETPVVAEPEPETPVVVAPKPVEPVKPPVTAEEPATDPKPVAVPADPLKPRPRLRGEGSGGGDADTAPDDAAGEANENLSDAAATGANPPVGTKAKPRVIPIVPPAELDSPPPLRVPAVTPPATLE